MTVTKQHLMHALKEFPDDAPLTVAVHFEQCGTDIVDLAVNSCTPNTGCIQLNVTVKPEDTLVSELVCPACEEYHQKGAVKSKSDYHKQLETVQSPPNNLPPGLGTYVRKSGKGGGYLGFDWMHILEVLPALTIEFPRKKKDKRKLTRTCYNYHCITEYGLMMLDEEDLANAEGDYDFVTYGVKP